MKCDSVHTAVDAAIVSVVSARYCGRRKKNAKLNVKLIIFLTSSFLSQIIRGRVKEEDGKIVRVHKIKWFLLRKRGQSTSGMGSLTTKKVAGGTMSSWKQVCQNTTDVHESSRDHTKQYLMKY